MKRVISIYDARTNLSKYVRQAQAGQTIYIGAYGQAQAMLAPLPQSQAVRIGIWSDRKNLRAYDYGDLVGSKEAKEGPSAAPAAGAPVERAARETDQDDGQGKGDKS